MKQLTNFGRNLEWTTAAYYEPRNEHEVLEILERHRGESIHAVGRLHSWSDAARGDGVILDLRHLQSVDVQTREDGASAIIGAGCQIKMVLAKLKQRGMTLPSIGLITEQTIAGAISTATHGSGRSSLSHYVETVRIARHDAISGKAIIEEIDSGDDLRAARCSIGCLGVILTVRIQCRPLYNVEEHWREYTTLDLVLAAETEFPLQQFFFVPWRWTFFAQHRRETARPRSKLAGLYRIYWFLNIDLGLHLLILLAIRLIRNRKFIRFLFQHVIPRAIVPGWKVVDESSAMLVMEHELFRHIEIELFVPARHVEAALDDLRAALQSGGEDRPVSSDETDAFAPIRGCYHHHYPICIRRVLSDDTLISMTSGDDPVWYAISLISYARPNERHGFFQFAEFLARTMSAKFGARPHWGKWCALSPRQLIALYPRFEQFRVTCQSRDSQGNLRNRWQSELFADHPAVGTDA